MRLSLFASSARLPAKLLLVGLCAPLSGCYSMLLEEFDSAAQWVDPLREPPTVAWATQPKQHSWYLSMIGYGPTKQPVDSPSEFARERINGLVDEMGDDLVRLGQVSRRLLWVADKDPNPFNRISALRGLEQVMREIEADPLDPASYFETPSRDEGRRLEAELRANYTAIEGFLPRPERGPLSDVDRRSYIAALRSVTQRPLPRPAWRRDLIFTTYSIYYNETDAEVRAVAEQAFRQAIQFAVCNGLRAALVPEALDAEDFPSVRIAALEVYRRVGGIRAVPFALALMARPTLGAKEHRFDRDLNVRMALSRMCAQLQYEHAVRSERAGETGPRIAPIEFLYETAVDEEEDEGLRRVALEGLARCLYRELEGPRVPEDLEWARQWWKRYVIDRGTQP